MNTTLLKLHTHTINNNIINNLKHRKYKTKQTQNKTIIANTMQQRTHIQQHFKN